MHKIQHKCLDKVHLYQDFVPTAVNLNSHLIDYFETNKNGTMKYILNSTTKKSIVL